MNLFSSFDTFEDVVIGFLVHQIYFAPVILLTLEEMGIPLPFADIVIAYTGYEVSIGHIPYVAAYIILLISDLIGATILYMLARKYGKSIIDKFGKYIDLDIHKLDVVEDKFRKFGPIVIVIGRHIYGFKVPITIFSGISKMKYLTFISSVTISDSFWIPFYMSIGQKLGKRTIHLFHIHHWFYAVALIPIALAFLPFLLMRKGKK